MPRLTAVVACLLLGLCLPALSGAAGARTATIYPASPLSGVITIDYQVTKDAPSNFGSTGTVETTLRLTKAGKVDIHVLKLGKYEGMFAEHGSWTSTLDLTYPEQCHTVHVGGTYSGKAVVFSWHYKGNNRFYMGVGPSPQAGFDAAYTRTEDQCEHDEGPFSGTVYWPLQVVEEYAEWWHSAGECAHTFSGRVHPGIQSVARHTTVRYQLTQLPDGNNDGIPDGGNAQTGTCGAKKPPPPPPVKPPGQCGASAYQGCPPSNPYAPGFVDSYSMAGICGKVPSGGDKGQPRCYILLGQKTIKAVKDHEVELAEFASIASGQIAKAMGEKVLISKARSKLISIALKKFAGETVEKANSALGFGKLMANIFTAAVYAQRWHDLGNPNFPPKCFGFQLTFDGLKGKPAFDPIYSFVRTWDRNDPPSIRGITTSNLRWWDQDKGHDYVLPLFCRGRYAQAVTTGSEPPPKLLAPPYILFDVDFSH